MNRVKFLAIVLLCIAVPGPRSHSRAGSLQEAKTASVRHYWGDVDGFLNRQAEVTLELVGTALLKFPPALPEPFERRMALLMIDGVLHDIDAPERPAVQDFFHSRMELVLKGLREHRVDTGALIWKLYNHGFIVRTATVTIAFDLVRGHSTGAEGFPICDSLIKQMAQHCDVLFISHRHGDHADRSVAQTFMDLGKPVVAPPDVWAEEPIHQRITHLKRDALKTQELSIQNGRESLKVIVYPGHQGDEIQNNVPLVFTPEGMSFSQTGDQSNLGDFSWIDEVAKRHRVDVLMPNCWTTDIARMIRGFDPQLIITGHENELGHSIDHREPFWMTYDLLGNSSTPFVLMTWGESIHYPGSGLSK